MRAGWNDPGRAEALENGPRQAYIDCKCARKYRLIPA